MTTPAEILLQLQTAWQTGPIASTASKARQPRQEPKRFGVALLAGNTAPCNGHVPPFDVIDEPDLERSGFIRSKCRHCKRFLGYRRTGKTVHWTRRS